MAIKGTISAQCPDGCEPFEAEVYSFIKRGADEEAYEALMGGELNLTACDACKKIFYPEVSVVYYDPAAELLCFMFPESHRVDEPKWRAKMQADCLEMRAVLGADAALEPELYFGPAELREGLELEERQSLEVEVAAHFCRKLGLKVGLVRRSYARARGLPHVLPLSGTGSVVERARKGLAALIKANDALVTYKKWAASLDKEEPPLVSEHG